MAAAPYELPDEGTLRWFLLDRKLDVAEAEEKLLSMLRWRREFGCVVVGMGVGAADRQRARGDCLQSGAPQPCGGADSCIRCGGSGGFSARRESKAQVAVC